MTLTIADLANAVRLTVEANTLNDYLFAVAIFIASLAILRVFKYVVIRRLHALSQKTLTDVDDLIIQVLDRVGWPFYVVLSLLIAFYSIELHRIFDDALALIVLLFGTYYAVRIVQIVINYGTGKVIAQRQKEEPGSDTAVIGVFGRILKGFLWIIAALFLLSSFGVEITPLLAGLGLGGIAIAFALQNVLSDVFASFSIYFDKPFQVGDFITIGTDAGTVKKIGIKSTRIHSLQGEELVISNKELTEARVRNYKRMEKRRVQFTIGVTYGTPTRKLKKIPEMVKQIISQIELAEPDRVHFKAFGDFSLTIEIVYFINSQDYTTYMDIQQRMNLALKERFEKEKIEFAYPTQMVYVEKVK